MNSSILCYLNILTCSNCSIFLSHLDLTISVYILWSVGLSFNGWDLKLKGASVYVNGPIGHEQSR